MKTQEELNALKEEVENMTKKLAELTEEELEQVTGGTTGEVKLFIGGKGFGFISPDQTDKQILQTYRKNPGSDKNAKIIYE